jgi:hypothetical protein
MVAAVNDFLADNRGKVPFDQYGRYLLPDPYTNEVRPWTRATTMARAITDEFNLHRWGERMLARGMALRGDLVAKTLADYDDDDVIDAVIAAAKEHAGTTVAATYGSAMHRFTERIDTGEDDVKVPDLLAGDLDAYTQALADHELAVMAVERIVCVPDLGVAGTFDRVLTRGERAWIADLKTGKDLAPAWRDIAVQLALYAHAAFVWSGTDWQPMPPVDQSEALVIHLPIGQGTCTLYAVDIAAGWDATVGLCAPVREWRKRKDLARVVDLRATRASSPAVSSGGDAADDPPGSQMGEPDRAGWITGRLHALAENDTARQLVAQHWPDGVTVKPPWSSAQIDALAAMLDDVERETEAPFPGDDPTREQPALVALPDELAGPVPEWDVSDDGVAAASEDVRALASIIQRCEPVQQTMLRRWAIEATQHERSFDNQPMTQRMWRCARAALSCAIHLGDDDRVRRALTEVVGWREGWLIGPVIGSLDSQQAEALADLADAYGAGNAPQLDPF